MKAPSHRAVWEACGGVRRLLAVPLAALLVTAAASSQEFPSRPPGRSASAASQQRGAEKLSRGRLLVAARGLRDPNFVEAVIVLLEHNDQGSLGLVINEPTSIRLAELLPDVKGLDSRENWLFRGGPVQPEALHLLIRGSVAPEGSRRVCEDVHVSTATETLEQLAAEPDGNNRFRVYAGYAGWGPGQLAAETSAGAWHVLAAEADAVFAGTPGDLWRRLIERTALRFARTDSERRRLRRSTFQLAAVRPLVPGRPRSRPLGSCLFASTWRAR